MKLGYITEKPSPVCAPIPDLPVLRSASNDDLPLRQRYALASPMCDLMIQVAAIGLIMTSPAVAEAPPSLSSEDIPAMAFGVRHDGIRSDVDDVDLTSIDQQILHGCDDPAGSESFAALGFDGDESGGQADDGGGGTSPLPFMRDNGMHSTPGEVPQPIEPQVPRQETTILNLLLEMW